MKILIVEDEYNLADAISSMLKKEKYSVEIKTDGEEGLEEALTDIYDLIIIDVMLPHKNGFEILKELREEHINSKILMLTAKSTIDDKMIGFNNGSSNSMWWTASPYSGASSFGNMWDMTSGGRNAGNYVHINILIRPYISLKADTVVLGGSGSSTDPYIITQ